MFLTACVRGHRASWAHAPVVPEVVTTVTTPVGPSVCMAYVARMSLVGCSHSLLLLLMLAIVRAFLARDAPFWCCTCLLMVKKSVTIMSWNVHGLGDREKCNNIRLAFAPPLPSIICFRKKSSKTLTPSKLHHSCLLHTPPPSHSLVLLGLLGAG
jgi:hypothetical protein